jgi:hypothetical protein
LIGIPRSERSHLTRLGLRGGGAGGSSVVLVTRTASAAELQEQRPKRKQRQAATTQKQGSLGLPPLIMNHGVVQLNHTADVAAPVGVEVSALLEEGVTRDMHMEVRAVLINLLLDRQCSGRCSLTHGKHNAPDSGSQVTPLSLLITWPIVISR